MGRSRWFPTIACAALVAAVLLPAVAAVEQDGVRAFGRVSALEGGLLTWGRQQDDWSQAELNELVAADDTMLTEEDSLAELEMPERVFLRLGESSGLDVLSITEHRYRLWEGSLYVAAGPVPGRVVSVETPACALAMADSALARIDVAPDGGVTVCALSGKVEVLSSGEATAEMQERFRLRVSPEGAFTGLEPMTGVLADRLAQWHLQRDAVVAGVHLPDTVPHYAVGAYELGRSGEWVALEGITYWKPAPTATWRPYYQGVWRHYEPVGWYWVPQCSFEYVTSRYGFWSFSVNHGWLWRPSWRWRPAHVQWVACTDGLLWAPIDWYHRPVVCCPPLGLGVSLSVGCPSGVSIGFWHYASFDCFDARLGFAIVSRRTSICDKAIMVDRGRVVKDIRTVKGIGHPAGHRGRPAPGRHADPHVRRRLDRRSHAVVAASGWSGRPAVTRGLADARKRVAHLGDRPGMPPGRVHGPSTASLSHGRPHARPATTLAARDDRPLPPTARPAGSREGADDRGRPARLEAGRARRAEDLTRRAPPPARRRSDDPPAAPAGAARQIVRPRPEPRERRPEARVEVRRVEPRAERPARRMPERPEPAAELRDSRPRPHMRPAVREPRTEQPRAQARRRDDGGMRTAVEDAGRGGGSRRASSRRGGRR